MRGKVEVVVVVEVEVVVGVAGEGVVVVVVVGGGRREEARLARRRGSVVGRNLKGVWKTEGAAAGGLKMIWSAVARAASALERPVSLLLGLRKDGCGGMLSARRVRAEVDFWRALVVGMGVRRRSRFGAAAARQQDIAGLVTMASMVMVCVLWGEGGRCVVQGKQLQLRREEAASGKGWQEELDGAAAIENRACLVSVLSSGPPSSSFAVNSTLDSLESRCEQLFLGRRRKAVTWMLGLSGQSWATRQPGPIPPWPGPSGAEGAQLDLRLHGGGLQFHSSSRGSSYGRWQFDV